MFCVCIWGAFLCCAVVFCVVRFLMCGVNPYKYFSCACACTLHKTTHKIVHLSLLLCKLTCVSCCIVLAYVVCVPYMCVYSTSSLFCDVVHLLYVIVTCVFAHIL